MKLRRHIYRYTDQLLCDSVTAADVQLGINEAEVYDQDAAIRQINLEYNFLNSKAASLLQHISLMITALSIIYAVITFPIIKAIIIIKIIMYLTVVLAILRVIYYVDFREIVPEKRRFILMEELKKRVVYFRLAHLATSVLTVLLVILLLVIEFMGAGAKAAC